MSGKTHEKVVTRRREIIMRSLFMKKNLLLIVILLLLIRVGLGFTKLNLGKYGLTLYELLESNVSVTYLDQRDLYLKNELNMKTIVINEKEKLRHLYNYLTEGIIVFKIPPMEKIFGRSGNEMALNVINDRASIFFRISDKRLHIRVHLKDKDIYKVKSYYFLLKEKDYQYIENLLIR